MPLGEVLRLDQHPVDIVATHTYPSCGVLNRGRGLFDKGVTGGSDTSYTRLFRLSEGQIVYSAVAEAFGLPHAPLEAVLS